MTASKLEVRSARVELVVLGLIMLTCLLWIFPYGFFLGLLLFWLCHALGQVTRLVGYVSHAELLALWRQSRRIPKNTTQEEIKLLPDSTLIKLTPSQIEYLGKIITPCLYILQPQARWAMRGAIAGNCILLLASFGDLPSGEIPGYILQSGSLFGFALAAMDMP